MARMPLSARRRALRRRRIWLGIGTGAVVAICAAFLLGAYLVRTSWWNETDPPPSADQQAADGTSMLDQSGIDYFTRTGTARVRIGDGALPATALGLEADGEKTIEPLVPISVVVLAPDGEFALGQVSELTVISVDDRVRSIRVEPGSSGAWPSIVAGLQHAAPAWGWSDADIAGLRDRVAASTSAGGVAEESMPTVARFGALASAVVRIDPDAATATIEYSVTAAS